MVVHHLGQFFSQIVGVQKVRDPDTATRHLVFISRANAPARGAYRFFALRLFACQIQCHVVGHDHRRGGRDHQSAANVNVPFFKVVDFRLQCLECNHHAVADHASHTRLHNAGRDQVQHGFVTVDHQGVSRIVPTLKTNHRIHITAQQIDNFALALVTPLGAQNNNALAHAMYYTQS